MDPKDVADNKVVAVMSYMFILVAVPVFVGRQSPYVRYHLNQALSLWCLALACLPLACVNFVIGLIPIIGWIIGGLIGMTVFLTLTGFAAYGVYNAATGRCVPLPIIGTAVTLIETYPPGMAPQPRQLPPG